MTINLHLPEKSATLRPTITVIGVGGAGGNAVNNMIAAQLEGVSFVVANTDAQAIDHALTDRTIQLGANITRGLGAGASPDVGRAAAEESIDEVAAAIEGSNMLFVTAGMGGGTGTGAAPVIARLSREMGILTVAVVTKPFQFEGTHRMRLADAGLEELQNYVDTMIVIPNQNLFRVANERTTFADAFRMADEVLHSGVRGVTDLMVMPGLINLDFADIRTVMREMGKAMMGTGEAEGENRAIAAAEAAISNPLLDDVSMKGARGVLINITGGNDMTLFEVDEAANRIRDEVDAEANIIFGSTFNPNMDGRMRVSVVSTGIESESQRRNAPARGTTTTAPNPGWRAAAPVSPATGTQGAANPSSRFTASAAPMAASAAPLAERRQTPESPRTVPQQAAPVAPTLVKTDTQAQPQQAERQMQDDQWQNERMMQEDERSAPPPRSAEFQASEVRAAEPMVQGRPRGEQQTPQSAFDFTDELPEDEGGYNGSAFDDAAMDADGYNDDGYGYDETLMEEPASAPAPRQQRSEEEAPRAQRQHHAPPAYRQEAPQPSGGARSGGMRFMQKVAGMGKAIAEKLEWEGGDEDHYDDRRSAPAAQEPRHQTRNTAPQPQQAAPRARATEASSAQGGEDDYLEIPAFLRRQAQ